MIRQTEVYDLVKKAYRHHYVNRYFRWRTTRSSLDIQTTDDLKIRCYESLSGVVLPATHIKR